MLNIYDSNDTYEAEIQKLISKKAYSTSDIFITIAGSKCKTKAAFFIEMSNNLSFPSYFSDNWDSLSDSVFEFLMLAKKNVLVYFSESALLLSEVEGGQTVFREILEDLSQNEYKKEISFVFSIL